MKKLLFLIFCVCALQQSNGQILISLILGDKLNSGKIEFGLDGGYSLSNMQNLADADAKGGFNLGFYFDIKTKHPQWMVNTGVVVKGPMGVKGLPVYSLEDAGLDSSFTGGSVTTKLSYFYVPVAMKYTFKNRLFLKGGIQLGLINSSKDEFINSIEDKNDLVYQTSRKGDFTTLDAGFIGGIGYRLQTGYGMNLGITYYYGLVDVEINDDLENVYNRVWYFNVGIPVGIAKAEKKALKEQQ